MTNDKQKINLDDLKGLACGCGHDRFRQSYLIKELSSIYTGRNTEVHPIPILVCEKCGKIFEAPKIIS